MPKKKTNLVSPLKLVDVKTLRSSFNFIPPKEETVELNREELFNNYNIDIDYAINPHDDDIVLIFIKCGVNFEQKTPRMGYELFAEMVNAFDISEVKKHMKEEEYKKLVVYSGLSIAVNNIRNCLYQSTIQGPFKEYILPAIDVQTLVDMKKPKSVKKAVSKKKTKSTAPNKG